MVYVQSLLSFPFLVPLKTVHSQAYPAIWAVLASVEIEQLKQRLNNLLVQTVHARFSLPLRKNKRAILQRLKVMTNHALLMPSGFRNFRNIHRTILQNFQNSQSCWIRQCREEKVARFVNAGLHVSSRSHEILFI